MYNSIYRRGQRTCSVKKLFLEISQIHRKMPVPEPLFNKVELKFFKKETVAQVFSCEFCEIFKNTFSYRTPSVNVSAPSVAASAFF